jgi:predicted transcriptional regulator
MEEETLIEEKKILIEERHLPEEKGSLGSKTISMLLDGSIQKVLKTPFCDNCGSLLGEQFTICSNCDAKICTSCTVTHGSKNYCLGCAKEIVPINKKEFMVIYGIAQEVNPKDIKKCSCMNSDDAQKALDFLLESGLIERKGLSILSRYVVTDDGLAIIFTSEQIYRNEGDVLRYLTKLQEFLFEG